MKEFLMSLIRSAMEIPSEELPPRLLKRLHRLLNAYELSQDLVYKKMCRSRGRKDLSYE